MHRIHKQARAERDLTDIWLYTYEEWGEAQANKYFDELDAGIRRLAENPELGKRCDYIRAGYRSLRVGHHLVYYTVTPSIIRIVRVLHERMDVGWHL